MRETDREYRKIIEKSWETGWTEDWVGVSCMIMVINRGQTLLPALILPRHSPSYTIPPSGRVQTTNFLKIPWLRLLSSKPQTKLEAAASFVMEYQWNVQLSFVCSIPLLFPYPNQSTSFSFLTSGGDWFTVSVSRCPRSKVYKGTSSIKVSYTLADDSINICSMDVGLYYQLFYIIRKLWHILVDWIE